MKMKIPVILLVLCIFLFADNIFAMSQKERIEDARSIINLFLQQYGPLKWKEKYLGINFNELADKLINDASNAKSDKEFYRLVALFLAQFKDAHVSYTIPSSLISYLPFDTEYFKDGVIIRNINRGILNTDIFPFNEGDILIAMDGVPVEKVIDLLSPFDENGYEPTTRKSVGSLRLTSRSQKMFIDIPTGKVTLTILPKGSNNPKDVVIEWQQRGFDVVEIPPKSAISYISKALISPTGGFIENDPIEQFERSHYVEIEGGNNASYLMNNPKPFFPMWDGFEQRLLMPFFTGIFNINNYKIGFIRINTWNVRNSLSYIETFAKEIAYMNNNTDALIIDQTGNGGGNICYPFWIGSFFMDKPKKIVKFQVRANRSWLSEIEDWYENGMGINKIHAKGWIDSLRGAVEKGDYLSDPISAFCFPTGEIFPYKNDRGYLNIYIKPVLLLINELDFSSADMFPAFMQDNKLATLFGARTAGAGGNVIGSNYIGNSELSIRLTQSLMYREKEISLENGSSTHYVENVGVTPEILYQITTKDYYDNYKSYREAINQAVLGLIEGQ